MFHEVSPPELEGPCVPLTRSSQHAEVVDSARVLLEAGEEIPCGLRAKLVKCLLLQAKRQDEQKREREQVSASGFT